MAEHPELHPIAERAAQLIAKNGDAPFVLDPVSAELLTKDLHGLFGRDELRRAVADLIKLAYHLEVERASVEAAEALLRVVETCVDALRALDAADGGAVPEVPEDAEAAKKLVGAEALKAPKIGESAPRGSVKLGSLDYPKRG